MQQCFVKLERQTCKPLVLAHGEHGNLWFLLISILVQHQHSYFNLARSMCSFYWCCIFPFVTFFTKNISAEEKTYVIRQLFVTGNIHMKTTVLESLFNKGAGLHPWTLLKRDSSIFFRTFFPVNIQNIKNSFFYRSRPVATSKWGKWKK